MFTNKIRAKLDTLTSSSQFWRLIRRQCSNQSLKQKKVKKVLNFFFFSKGGETVKHMFTCSRAYVLGTEVESGCIQPDSAY